MSLDEEKELLIKKLIDLGYLRTQPVINAFRKIKREDFIPLNMRSHAYEDVPLPIGFGQTISQPLTVAAMTEALDVHKGHKILEIGSGSGYQAALLAEIAGRKGLVVTMERIKELYEFAKSNLEKEKYTNVKVVNSDGTLGCQKYAPYDRILVAADAPRLPEPLKKQLRKSGKIIIPISGVMTLFEKSGDDSFTEKVLGYYIFVPLIGKHGHSEL